VINNFNSLEMRPDVGQLWENFMISERFKHNAHRGHSANAYFWRTHQQQEIDYLEESEGKLSAFEFKWRTGKFRVPKIFLKAYPGSQVKIVNTDNFKDFVQNLSG
jgi:hypothetical protein